MFLEMCILSGCDYINSLPGVGVKKAHGLIKRFRTYSKVHPRITSRTSCTRIYSSTYKNICIYAYMLAAATRVRATRGAHPPPQP